MTKYTVEQIKNELTIVTMDFYEEGPFVVEYDIHRTIDDADLTDPTWTDILLQFDEGVGVVADHHTNAGWKVSPYTRDGSALYVIPWEYVKAVYTRTEYEELSQCIEADQKLLSYAK